MTSGVQRKEINDLVASVHDGRLGRQLTQMKTLGLGVLLLEGRPQWTTDGLLLGNTNWTVAQHRGLMWSVQSRGIWLGSAETLAETIDWLLMFQRWCEKERHHSLLTRPKGKDEWGKIVSKGRDFAIYFLQSFPGIGSDMAMKIYDHFNGLPMAWTVTEEELMTVPGVGRTRAKQLIQALGTSSVPSSSSTTTTEQTKKGRGNGRSGQGRKQAKHDDLAHGIDNDLIIDMT